MEEHDIRELYDEIVDVENELENTQALIMYNRIHGELLKIKDFDSPQWKTHLRLKEEAQLLRDYLFHLMEELHTSLKKLETLRKDDGVSL